MKKLREIEMPTRLLCRKQQKVQPGSHHQRTGLQHKNKTMDNENVNTHRAFLQKTPQTKIQKENYYKQNPYFRSSLNWSIMSTDIDMLLNEMKRI